MGRITITSRMLFVSTLIFFSGIHHLEAKTIKYEKVQLDIAQTEIPFEELLDIGIMLFDPNLPKKEDPMIFPEIIPMDGTGEDVIARQIREAAIQEDDPLIREALWEEYRKHMGIKK